MLLWKGGSTLYTVFASVKRKKRVVHGKGITVVGNST